MKWCSQEVCLIIFCLSVEGHSPPRISLLIYVINGLREALEVLVYLFTMTLFTKVCMPQHQHYWEKIAKLGL